MSTGIGLRIVVAVAILSISILATPASAGGRCNNASLRGSYAFQVDGANGDGAFAAVGKNTYDGNGNLSGEIVISSNGVIIPANLPSYYTGTYTLNDNCTGLKTATLDIGLTVQFYFVVDNNLREIRMIVVTPGFTVSGTATKLFTSTDSRRKDD